MLISRKHKFIFVHVYKNAGTSVKKALMPYAANQVQALTSRFLQRYNLPTIRGLDPRPYPSHIKASDLVTEMGRDVFDSYFSFAIVRNPWDWQVSLYKYMLKHEHLPQHKIVKDLAGFDDYIKWRCAKEARFQKDFICSKNNIVLVDFVARFERLDADFKSICSHIGISASLPKLNVSNTIPYQEFYNEDTRSLVAKTFASDIELFEYSFDTC